MNRRDPKKGSTQRDGIFAAPSRETFVDGWLKSGIHSPVEGTVVEIPLFTTGFIHPKRWLALGFLNHQQSGSHTLLNPGLFIKGSFWPANKMEAK